MQNVKGSNTLNEHKISKQQSKILKDNRTWLEHLLYNKWLYIMMLPGVLYFIIFRYVPMWGIVMAFQKYSPTKGITGSRWVGLYWFKEFLTSPDFMMLLKNTLSLGVLNISIGFAFPILLALLLNEMRGQIYKRCIQTAIYVPHFVSWTIVASITTLLLTSDGGGLYELISKLVGHNVDVLTQPKLFKPMIVAQGIWKESGYGTIIYLASLASVDMEQYEAAMIDGAGRFKRVLHVTLPAIQNTIIIMLILRCGSFLSTGFDQIYLMANSLNRSAAQVFDTYVYTVGITQGMYSYSTAIGLFKSIVGIILILSSNLLAKKIDPDAGIF